MFNLIHLMWLSNALDLPADVNERKWPADDVTTALRTYRPLEFAYKRLTSTFFANMDLNDHSYLIHGDTSPGKSVEEALLC